MPVEGKSTPVFSKDYASQHVQIIGSNPACSSFMLSPRFEIRTGFELGYTHVYDLLVIPLQRTQNLSVCF